MEIRIIKSIDDPFLKSEWERLEKENDIFPQSTYHWCSTWWKYLSQKRVLHITMLFDDNDMVVAIMPLCIERVMSIRVLKSFPINYGDFFQIIIDRKINDEFVFKQIYDYMKRFETWDVVLLRQVSSRSKLYSFLTAHKIPSMCLVRNVIADLNMMTGWDDYQSKLSYNRRRLVRKKMRLLEKEKHVGLELLQTSKEYLSYVDMINAIQKDRWENDNRPKRSPVYLECTKEINSRLFDLGKMVLYLLKAGDAIISYRIGIIHNCTYYDWDTNYSLKWGQYSPGQIGLAYVIKDLIEKDFKYIDFMAGYYDYKVSYSPKATIYENYMFLLERKSISGYLYKKYQFHWRPHLKSYYVYFQECIKKHTRVNKGQTPTANFNED